MALEDFWSLVDDLTRDDTGKVTSLDRDEAIGLAVQRYSKDRPRTSVDDVTVTVAGNLADLPAGWQADFSQLQSLELPIGEVPPAFLESEGFQLYQSPSGIQIMTARSLSIGEILRASFTIRHVVDATTDTVPTQDREAVAAWAAALLLDQLAALFSGDSDSTIQADSVDHNSKASEYAARAKAARRRYFEELGLDPKRKKPAGTVVDLDLKGSHGQDRLTHRRVFR